MNETTTPAPAGSVSGDAPLPLAAIRVDTPDGPFTVIADASAVVAAGWTANPAELAPLAHLDPADIALVSSAERAAPESPREPRPGDEEATADPAAQALARRAADAVRAYYAGDLEAPRALPTRQRTGPFISAARETLRDVAPGQAVTYGELAALAGRSGAARAAAQACSRNAVALFVPCHRVLPTSGGAGGFRYDAEIKRALLAREGVRVS